MKIIFFNLLQNGNSFLYNRHMIFHQQYDHPKIYCAFKEVYYKVSLDTKKKVVSNFERYSGENELYRISYTYTVWWMRIIELSLKCVKEFGIYYFQNKRFYNLHKNVSKTTSTDIFRKTHPSLAIFIKCCHFVRPSSS